jgi:hypothetical protein
MRIKIKILLLVIVAGFMTASCKYDWIIPEEVPEIDPNDPNQEISFSGEILPIFNSGNNCTACHNGSQAPDLREESAYSSLNSTRYINKTSPEESRIYAIPHPDGGHYKTYTATEAALVLAWIQQGAKNN